MSATLKTYFFAPEEQYVYSFRQLRSRGAVCDIATHSIFFGSLRESIRSKPVIGVIYRLEFL